MISSTDTLRSPSQTHFARCYACQNFPEGANKSVPSHNLPGVMLVTTDLKSHLSVDGDVLGVTGYSADEFVALDPMRDFLSPKADRVKLASMIAAMMDPTQAFVEVDIPYIHKDGHTIWLRACHGSRAVGTTANGRPKVMAVFSDVTAKIQREAVTETWTEDDSELRSSVMCPHHIPSHRITSHRIASQHSTAAQTTQHSTSHHTTSHIPSHHTTSHIPSHHITSHHITPHHIFYHITSHHITYSITSHHITSHHITYSIRAAETGTPLTVSSKKAAMASRCGFALGSVHIPVVHEYIPLQSITTTRHTPAC